MQAVTLPTPARPPRRRAVLIGVNTAPGLGEVPPLEAAERDARDLAGALEAHGDFTVVQLLLGPQATAAAVQDALDDLLSDASPQDELLVYFSGHALALQPDDPASEVLLGTADLDLARARRQRWQARFLSLRALYAHVYAAAGPGAVALILDCCYAGNLVGPQPLPPSLDLRMLLDIYQRERGAPVSFAGKLRWLLAAAGPGELAGELLGHGLLTRPLLAALRGELPAALTEGLVTPHTLMAVLEGELRGFQRPAALLVSHRDFVLADHRAAFDGVRRRADLLHRQEAAAERQTVLRALLHDHSGFLRDRLESFVGRATELAQVQTLVVERRATGGYVTITGQAGQGKSSMIAKLVELALRAAVQVDDQVDITQLLERTGPEALAYHFIPFQPGPDHQVGLLRNLMARLILKYDLPELYVASDSRPALRDYFARVLSEVAAKGGREVIFLDGLDQIEEDASGTRDLSFLPIDPPPGIVFVLGTRPNDTLRPLELRRPHTRYELPNLSRADFDLILQRRGVALAPDLADRFYATMHASALYLDLVGRELAHADAEVPEQIIARVADNPNHLFSLAVERLKRHAPLWREVIKPTLGLLLAAREPLHLRAARALLGRDQDEVREGLERLGGLLSRDGEGRFTLFHLKLRDFLRDDPAQPDRAALFPADEEERWHQRLADWAEQGFGGLEAIWQDRSDDPLEQERRAYARQHYLAHLCLARDWPRLWAVLDAGDYAAAKLRHDPSARSLVLDLDLVRQRMAAASRGRLDEGLDWLPRLWRYSLLRASLASQTDNYPEGLIPLLARLGRVQEALGLAEVLTDEGRKVRTLLGIGRALGEEGRAVEAQQLVRRAREVAQQIADAEARTEATRAVVEALVETRQVDTALVLAYSAAPDEGRATVLRGLVQALVTASQHDLARQCALDARDIAGSLSSSTVHIKALLAAAEALQAAALADAACSCVWEAREAVASIVVASDRIASLLAVAEASGAMGQLDVARACVLDAKKTADSLTNIFGRDYAYEIVAGALVNVDLLDLALELRSVIANVFLRSRVQCAIVTALAKVGQTAAALDLAKSIADEHIRAQAQREVAEALAKARQTKEALDLARSITHGRMRASVQGAVVEVLAKEGQTKEALDLARSIEETWTRAWALVAVAEAWERAEQRDAALACSAEAVLLARSIDHVDTFALTLRLLAGALTAAGQPDIADVCAVEMERLALAAVDRDKQAEMLEKVVSTLVGIGQLDRALELTRLIETSRERAWALLEVVESLTRTGQHETAQTYVAEARQLALAVTPTNRRSDVLSGVAQALVMIGEQDAALELIGTIEEPDAHAIAQGWVVESLVKVGHRDEALDLAHAIPYAGRRDQALGLFVEALVATGDVDNSLSIARSITDASESAQALLAVAKQCAATGQGELAWDYAMEARKVADCIDDVTSYAVVIGRIAEIFVMTGHLDVAVKLAHSLAETYWRAQVLSIVSLTLVKAEQPTAARAYVTEVLGHLAQLPLYQRSDLLYRAGVVMSDVTDPAAVLGFLHDYWPALTRRDDLLALLPAAAPLIAARPALLQELLDGVVWVDQMLQAW
ncbi:MAG TPA: AAA family ATPase [Roseiflexaceae bacterium]|nr:AAA family ATPase [Roseiflexaceae bacterium]